MARTYRKRGRYGKKRPFSNYANAAVGVYKMAKNAYGTAQRVKKVWRSATKSRSKTYVRNEPQRTGTGGTITRYSSVLKAKPYYKRVLKEQPFNTQLTNGGWRSEGLLGTQGGMELMLNAKVDVDVMFTKYSADELRKIYMKWASYEIQLTNRQNGNVRITIYDLQALGDHDNPPITAWKEGLVDMGQTGTPENVMGQRPENSISFKRQWKILKKRTFVMACGEVHEHRVFWSIERAISKDVLDLQAVSGFNGKKYRTYACLILFNGMPVSNSDNDYEVTIGSSAIDMCYQKRYKYCAFAPGVKYNHYVSDSLLKTISGTEKIMEMDGDANNVINV